MVAKLESVTAALTQHDEKLMDQHGEGILEGFTREFLDGREFQQSQ